MSSPSWLQLLDPDTLISTFDALPRNQLSPSGIVPNHWHISLRQVPLQPQGQVLFLINPAARYIHVDSPLPPEYNSGTTEAKAMKWSARLLMAFSRGLGANQEDRRAGAIVGRPWSWVCNDAEMAGAVGEVMSIIGVQAPEVGLAGDEENRIADEEWRRYLEKLHNAVRMGP